MATYLIQIPANYRARVGGNSSVSVDASSPQEARTQVVQAGIPAALIGNPTEITGNITSGSLPPNVSEYILPTSGPDRNPLLRDDRIIGANNYTNQPVRELQFYPDGSPKSTGQNTSLRRDASGRIIRGGTEESSGNPFAANINRPPTMAEVQAALPYQLGTPESPFYQPPSYQRMTSEDFARIRANANQPLFDEGSFLGGAFNTGGSLPAGSFATDTEPLEDIDALEAENFARQERERLAKIRREAAAAAAATTADAADAARRRQRDTILRLISEAV